MKLFIIPALLVLLFCGACTTDHALTIYGDECQALTEEQFNYLIALARGTLKKNADKYKFTQEERDIIEKTAPRLQTEYRGDRYGTLFILWDTPQRRLGMRYENQLDIAMPSCAMIIGSTDGNHVGGIKPDKTRRGR